MEGTRVVGRFDFAYPDAKLIIETDGYRWHSGNQAWQRDRRRDNDLNRLGWTVLRFTAEDMKSPCDVVRQIRSVLTPSLDV
jgi:very-short-patch-repair endonuclease